MSQAVMVIDPRLSAAVPPRALADLYATLQELCQFCGHWQGGKCDVARECDSFVAWEWEGAEE